MHCFYCEDRNVSGGKIRIEGSDVNHMKNVLRMKEGETLTVCDRSGMEYFCEVAEYLNGEAILNILKKGQAQTELPVRLVLYQGLPKKDKMELIIQKAVELGAAEIVPVMTKRCIVKLEDDKKETKKIERWQAIAESAAKQSKRSIIPEVRDIVSYKNALKMAEELDVVLVPYENKDGMKATKEALAGIKSGMSVGIFIGPEGGFDEKEIETAVEMGGKTISLGKRILRTETAAITAVGMCMLYAETELGEE